MLGQSAKRAPRAIQRLAFGACGAGMIALASLSGCILDSAGLLASEAQTTGDGGLTGAGGAGGAGAGGAGAGGGLMTLKVTLDVQNDTYVEEATKTANFGGTVYMRLHARSRPLIRFNVAAIPFGAKVTAAKLSLFIEGVDPTALVETIRVHAILSGNKGWVEGFKNGSIATAGEPSWALKEAQGVVWAGAEGLDLEDTDYKQTPEGLIETKFKPAQAYEWDLSTEVIQQWADDPATNHGFIVLTPSTLHYIITSKESPQMSSHPTLTVSYTLDQ
jgi:hypothetical protein